MARLNVKPVPSSRAHHAHARLSWAERLAPPSMLRRARARGQRGLVSDVAHHAIDRA
jgi:hypothetical protein